MKKFYKINLKKIEDLRDGIISVAESNKEIPFDIKRVYFITDLHPSESTRGYHAHKNLDQAIFCISGSFTLMLDNGEEKESFLLNDSNAGMFLPKHVWHTMSNFSKNCILLIFASDYFDENDYLRNYSDFKKFINV